MSLSLDAVVAIRSAGLGIFYRWPPREERPIRTTAEIVDEVLARQRQSLQAAREATLRLAMKRVLRAYGIPRDMEGEVVDHAVTAWRSGRT